MNIGKQIHITPQGTKEYQMEQVCELTPKGKTLETMLDKLQKRKRDGIDTLPIKNDLEVVINGTIHEIYDVLFYHATQIDKKDLQKNNF